MANSQQIAIREAVAQLLTGVAGGRIHQNRKYTLPTGVDSQVHVNVRGTDPDTEEVFTGHPVDWETQIEIVVKARATSAADADKAADAIWQQVYAAVMGDATALGGLSMGITPGSANPDEDEAENGVASLTWVFTVLHRTSNDVLT